MQYRIELRERTSGEFIDEQVFATSDELCAFLDDWLTENQEDVEVVISHEPEDAGEQVF